jgi:signal transduction histidine kinase
MAGLVDNIMDFARGRLGGGLTIRRDTAHPLTPVLEQVIAELKSVWPGVAIDALIDVEEPVNCDRGKMGQLFSNLLANAITYGDQARPIRVVARTIDGVFELAIANYGEPISEKAMENLFEPYTRGERPSQQGLGLGLYIASQIAKAHGGSLTATSNPHETRFVFQMPQRTG